MNKKRQLALWSLLLTILTLATTQIPVKAAQTQVPIAVRTNTSELIAQATQNGHIRVIVALNVPFQPETGISNALISSQRSLIQQTQQRVTALLSGMDAQTVATFKTIPYLTMDADASAIQRLADSGLVRQIIKENVLYPLLAQSVPYIGAPAVWASGFDGTNQTVAVLDTGVDKDHPFLAQKVVAEACYSLSGGTNVSLCPNGVVTGGISRQTGSGAGVPCTVDFFCLHGTHVAGIVAGANGTFNGETFNGVAKGAKIIAIQVFHQNTNVTCSSNVYTAPCVESTDTEILLGLEQVYNLRTSYPIAAVNLSLGGGQFGGHCDLSFPYYYDIIAQLKSVGIAVVAGSGNSRSYDAILAPACISNAISVGATGDTTDTVWDDSTIFGSAGSDSAAILDLLAPGENITSSVPQVPGVPQRGYAEEDGTSMATPHVAGAFALLRSVKPNATVDQILAALQNTGVRVRDPLNLVWTPRIQVNTAATALITNALPTTGKIVINEIRVQSNQSVELFNAGSSSVNMTGWNMIIYDGNSTEEITYTFPSFTLNSGSYVVLNRGVGTNTATTLYMGNYATTWASGGSGAVLLKSGNIGIDFVRWGNSTLMPLYVTGWSGQNPAGSLSGQNLGRDPLTNDLDDAGEWSTQSPTLGTINQPTRPANDDFTNSILIPGFPYTGTPLLTFTATLQSGEPNSLSSCPLGSSIIGRTVWYRYIPTTTQTIGFDTVGSDFDTIMAVYIGSWGALNTVGCNDDIVNGAFPQSQVVLSVNAGETYYIQVGGLNSASGHLQFHVGVPKLNDDFDNAATISSLPYVTNQNTTTSTTVADDPIPPCNGDTQNTVWFSYTASATQMVRFETTGSDFDTVLSTWTGMRGSLAPVTDGCSDDQDLFFGTDLTSLVEIQVVSGTTYYIMVSGGAAGSSGNLLLNVESLIPPPNPPILLQPLNGASLATSKPTFSWAPASYATGYQIQISSNPVFGDSLITLLDTSYVPTDELLTQNYYWHVRSLGENNNISAWSATRSVIVASAVNAAPILNFKVALPVTLSWGRVSWASGYEIQVDNEKSFAKPLRYDLVVFSSTLSVQLNSLEHGTYYWRVRAKNSDGTWGGWTSIESFLFSS